MISKDNYTCPICLGIFIDPCKLPCNHIFCLPCLLELVDFNFIQYKCPMCRNEFMNNNGPFKIDQEIQTFIQTHFKEEFEKRQQEIMISQKEKQKEMKIRVNYGNTYDYIEEEKNNKHLWSVYVTLDYINQYDQTTLNQIKLIDLIESVTFYLDETFYPDFVVVRHPPFKITRKGWDVFSIPIEITFKKQYELNPIKLEHHLVFQQNGILKCQISKINAENIKKQLDFQNQQKQNAVQNKKVWKI
ncbi:unnamed protein product [Paramecium primaurelia]|uniref:RING-type E3 ubiquitin transferase n=1 Tax=Paramecium primaurelia TaxID=5886 RepID=A0A8S1L0Q7_PARPR|nr:unnamed protein product [Paramecium primaurelia]